MMLHQGWFCKLTSNTNVSEGTILVCYNSVYYQTLTDKTSSILFSVFPYWLIDSNSPTPIISRCLYLDESEHKDLTRASRSVTEIAWFGRWHRQWNCMWIMICRRYKYRQKQREWSLWKREMDKENENSSREIGGRRESGSKKKEKLPNVMLLGL